MIIRILCPSLSRKIGLFQNSFIMLFPNRKNSVMILNMIIPRRTSREENINISWL